MPSITATLDNPNARVRLDIDCSDIGAPYVYVTRINDATGAVTPVRIHGTAGSLGGLAHQSISAGFAGVVYDTEVPYDTAVHYALTAPSWQLLANVAFTATTEPWVATGCTLAYGANPAALPIGVAGLTMQPDGVTANPGAQSELVLAAPGATYTLTGAILGPQAVPTRVLVSWYDASQVLLSTTTLATMTLTLGQPTVYTYTVVAPASTRYARVTYQITGTPAATVAVYWYGTAFSNWPGAAATATSGSVTVTNQSVWRLRDPLRPANDLTITESIVSNLCTPGGGICYVSLVDRGYANNSSRFNIAGQRQPQTVSRVRQSMAGTLTLLTRTAADEAALNALLAPGSPLLLQSPPAYGLPDMYLSIDAVGADPISPDQTLTLRAFRLPFVAELAPGGPPLGVPGATWADTCDWTWASASAGSKTWLNLMDGGL